jgi:hypothetical protein
MRKIDSGRQIYFDDILKVIHSDRAINGRDGSFDTIDKTISRS